MNFDVKFARTISHHFFSSQLTPSGTRGTSGLLAVRPADQELGHVTEPVRRRWEQG